MRKYWLLFIIIQLVIITAAGAIIYRHYDKVQLIKTPPSALAQWYKPHNKRQVWLHNMFKLRREMQAVGYYAKLGDVEHLQQWLKKLKQHYLKIGEMLPIWNKKIDLSLISSLQRSTQQQLFTNIPAQLQRLSDNCQSCHVDYRAITATKYRAPDFSTITLANDLSFNQHMIKLSEQVNLIKIAASDGFTLVALEALQQLNQGIEQLGQTCISCHHDYRKALPTAQMLTTLAALQQALTTGSLKDQGQQLGTLAVQVCATCHATHRLSYDNRVMLTAPRSLLQLIKQH